MTAALRNPALRHARDWFFALGAEFEWLKKRRSPVELITEYCRDHDDGDSHDATDALVFASPVADWHKLVDWIEAPERTFQDLRELVEAADVAVNGGDP